MEMETLLIVFMAFACLICVFSVVLIILDMVRDSKARKAQKSQSVAQAQPQVESQVPATTAPIAADPIPAVAAESEPSQEPIPENAIWITTGKNQTLEEKYLELSAEQKGWYDEIERYVMAVDQVKRFKNERYCDYKIGKNRIVRLSIKRNVIQCEFVLVNQDFRNFVNESKISVKQAATVLRVESAEGVDAAKNGVDIAVKAVEEERLYKKEQAKLRRKAARAAKQNKD